MQFSSWFRFRGLCLGGCGIKFHYSDVYFIAWKCKYVADFLIIYYLSKVTYALNLPGIILKFHAVTMFVTAGL
jgi:hypothetical protein